MVFVAAASKFYWAVYGVCVCAFYSYSGFVRNTDLLKLCCQSL